MGIQLTKNIREVVADKRQLKQFGKAGISYEEAQAGAEVKLEKELHEQYMGFLNRNGFKHVLHAPMFKKSHLPQGHPDFTVMRFGKTFFVEFKVAYNDLSTKQQIYIAGLRDDGFTVIVARTHEYATTHTKAFFNL